MGNKQLQTFNWEDHYRIVERNFNDGTLIVQKTLPTGYLLYIGRELHPQDQRTLNTIKSLIQIKLNNSNPYVTSLSAAYTSSDQALCGMEDKIFVMFAHPGSTLKQEIIARRFACQSFTEPQIDILIESAVKGIKSLKEQGHPHNNISSSSVFLNEDREILLGDPWATPPAYSINQNQNGFSYPSPEKILYQNDQIFQFDPYRSDLFSVGTIALESLHLQHMDVIYEKGFRRVMHSKIEQKLAKISDPELKKKLQILLSFDPKNRQKIYSFYESMYSKDNMKKKLATMIKEKAQGKIPQPQTIPQPLKINQIPTSHVPYQPKPKSVVRINYINRPQYPQYPQKVQSSLKLQESQKTECKQVLTQSSKDHLKTSNSEHRLKQDHHKEQPIKQLNILSESKEKTPNQSIQLSQQFIHNEQRKTTSQNSDRGFLESINDAQLSHEPIIQTPDKRPKKKFNSTIKEVSENSSKEESMSDNAIYVEEEYSVGRYEGFKRNGLRNGKGKFYYTEGSMYEGEWKNNQMHGYGTLYYSNGKIAYEGSWFLDEFNGTGKVYNQEENSLHGSYDYTNLEDFQEYWLVYEGELVSDQRHGKGKIKLSNGEMFVGQFNHDIIQGEGEYHTLNGEVINGVWANNKLLKLR